MLNRSKGCDGGEGVGDGERMSMTDAARSLRGPFVGFSNLATLGVGRAAGPAVALRSVRLFRVSHEAVGLVRATDSFFLVFFSLR